MKTNNQQNEWTEKPGGYGDPSATSEGTCATVNISQLFVAALEQSV